MHNYEQGKPVEGRNSRRTNITSRRIHPHQYRPRTRHHRMTSGDVGHAINTMTYRHNHNEGVHEHDFHPRIQRHWSRNPDDGRDLGAGSYEHSHQGGMDERNKFRKRGRARGIGDGFSTNYSLLDCWRGGGKWVGGGCQNLPDIYT